MKVAKEGVNGWITGAFSDVETYCAHLRTDLGDVFGSTDFKISPCSEQELSRGVKVWESGSVCKLLEEADAYQELSSQARAPHLSPQEWHEKLARGGEDLVLFDVRNFYETRIGHFDAPGDQGRPIPRIDPRTLSYEQVPEFLAEEENLSHFQGKTVMMYCTGGVRCERASTLLRSALGEQSQVFQLQGGIHRYLESYPTGGFFQGSMYVFDRRRFVRGPDLLSSEAAAEVEACSTVVGECCICGKPWERYQGKWKCGTCKMPVLICLSCQGRKSRAGTRADLRCELCAPTTSSDSAEAAGGADAA